MAWETKHAAPFCGFYRKGVFGKCGKWEMPHEQQSYQEGAPMKRCKWKKTCAGCQWVRCAWCENWKPKTVDVYPTDSGEWETLATGVCSAWDCPWTVFVATDGAGCKRFVPRDCEGVRK